MSTRECPVRTTTNNRRLIKKRRQKAMNTRSLLTQFD